MSTVKVNAITDASGGNTATINSMTPTADSLQGFRNRIINGDMRIDQRNAGASVTPASGAYLVDRFYYAATQASKFTAQRNAGSITPPAGFTNYLGLTVASAVSVGAADTFYFGQIIEGFNIADLAWGTANARAVTISFWVRSSLTGTHSGTVGNTSITRTYPFSFTISAANTWEQKTVTISGDTSGTWATDNTTGLYLLFNLGSGANFSGTAGSWAAATRIGVTGAVSVVGTNGATFYITGVQLEVGSTATPFERRPYGTELMLCQRYYATSYQGVVAGTAANYTNSIYISSNNNGVWLNQIKFPVTMRATPTVTFYSPWSGTAARLNSVTTDFTIAVSTNNSVAVNGVDGVSGTANGLNANFAGGVHYTANIEL